MVKNPLFRYGGFILIEGIVVIVITGIIASIVAMFIRHSVDAYVSTSHRAELTDAADLALRRLAREVRLAVPNSLRISPAVGCPAPENANTCDYLEFVPTVDGGRYRAEGDGSTVVGNPLCSGGTVNTTFDVLGIAAASLPPVLPARGDSVVVYNDANLPCGIYCGGSRALVTGRAAATAASAATITTTPALANSAVICANASYHFQVVDGSANAVTYACPTATAGTLRRYWGYGYAAAQPTPSAGGSSAPVVQNANCAISYTPGALARNGLLSITLTITDRTAGTTANEQIVAFRQIHVDNTP